MPDRPTPLGDKALSFGPFRLLPAQQLLLEEEAPVRLGSRALEILTALVERGGEVVSKKELIARVWPDTFVADGNLRVHIAGLRRALGDGQPGRRYIANTPGRGYRFVAPVSISDGNRPEAFGEASAEKGHNLSAARTRPIGRTDAIHSLVDQLPKSRFITLVGTGGGGKTTVAVAAAEALLKRYKDGVWFVDLSPVDNSKYVATALGAALGLSVNSENAIPQLADFLRDRQLLIVLDSCEHHIETTAILVEALLAAAPGINVLATSREPLRAAGERIRRLSPLEIPPATLRPTMAEALAFPAVQLFAERAAATLYGYELSDEDAPVVAEICRKLGGIALAIELAAARVDAFGVTQLSALLDDRFRILKQGKRTAHPRHRSLTAALDWSYEFLPESEREVLRRLAIFSGAFSLESAVSVADTAESDVIEAIANLVAKSLIAADVGGATVHYQLLDTTREYARRKLIDSGGFGACAERHAQHLLEWCEQAAAGWMGSPAEFVEEYGRRSDDVRNALKWAFSPVGRSAVGVALTVVSVSLWVELSPMDESRERIELALKNLEASTVRNSRTELNLILYLILISPHARPQLYDSQYLLVKGLALAEELCDDESFGRLLFLSGGERWFSTNFRESLALAEQCSSLADRPGHGHFGPMAATMIGNIFHSFGDYAEAIRHLGPFIDQRAAHGQQRAGFEILAKMPLANILWLQGFPDRAVTCVSLGLKDTSAFSNSLILRSTFLALAAIPTALRVGDFAEADRLISMLLSYSSKGALSTWGAVGRCLKGSLLLDKGEPAGVALVQTGLEWLRDAKFLVHYTIFLGVLAQGLAAAGRHAEARDAIDEAIQRSDRTEELWCMPELLRIKGEIVLLAGNGLTEAVDFFEQASEWARRQGALSWELRAAMSLAKLWRDTGQVAEANRMLSLVYARFTEGFGTRDLIDARALIEELGSVPG